MAMRSFLLVAYTWSVSAQQPGGVMGDGPRCDCEFIGECYPEGQGGTPPPGGCTCDYWCRQRGGPFFVLSHCGDAPQSCFNKNEQSHCNCSSTYATPMPGYCLGPSGLIVNSKNRTDVPDQSTCQSYCDALGCVGYSYRASTSTLPSVCLLYGDGVAEAATGVWQWVR